jgi:nucleotide-binding universal stress UspA family protein
MVDRIVVPVDGSPLGDRALAFALREHPDAETTVVHVVDPVQAVYAAEAGGPTFAEEQVERARADGEALLESAREAAGEFDATVDTVLRVGPPADTVLSVAEEVDADLVVVGRHGRSTLSTLVLGSVSKEIVRECPVPVVVVR